LTFWKLPGLIIRRRNSVALDGEGDVTVLAMAGLFKLPSSDFDGDLTREIVGLVGVAAWPCEALVGLVRREKLEERDKVPEPFPLVLGRGMEVPSREMGRDFDASSSRDFLILFTKELCGSSTGVVLGLPETEKLTSSGCAESPSSSFARDEERFKPDFA
jgi:hypothetical protein